MVVRKQARAAGGKDAGFSVRGRITERATLGFITDLHREFGGATRAVSNREDGGRALPRPVGGIKLS